MLTLIEFRHSGAIYPHLDVMTFYQAGDVDDLRRQLHAAGNMSMAEYFYRMTFSPAPGKYVIGDRYLLLVG